MNSCPVCSCWIADGVAACDSHATVPRRVEAPPSWSHVRAEIDNVMIEEAALRQLEAAEREEEAEAKPAGVKYDAGKRAWRLLPWDALGLVVDVLGWAVRRTDPKPYPEHNWRHVPDGVDRYYDALMRHLTAWQMHRQGLEGGSDVDEQSGIHHLAHAACNALFLVALVVCRKPRR